MSRRTIPRLLNRRQFLVGAGTLAGLASGCPSAFAGELHSDPFTLGVASGDPLPGGVVLWTRLAPEPLAGGGMPDRAFQVHWEVASDERFSRVVLRGRAK